MAANWQCKCGEIVYCNGEPNACMECGDNGDWHIYVPTAEEIAEQEKIDAEWAADYQPALHKGRAAARPGGEALGGAIGGKADASDVVP